jgi:hypothetical protein
MRELHCVGTAAAQQSAPFLQRTQYRFHIPAVLLPSNRKPTRSLSAASELLRIEDLLLIIAFAITASK